MGNGVKYYAWLEHAVVNRKGIEDSQSAIGYKAVNAEVHVEVCDKLKEFK